MDKRFVRFKVAKEIYEDKKMFMTILEEECKRYGIDVDQPYQYEVGYEKKDYINNTLTVFVTQ
jgi:hypothetical protein